MSKEKNGFYRSMKILEVPILVLCIGVDTMVDGYYIIGGSLLAISIFRLWVNVITENNK